MLRCRSVFVGFAIHIRLVVVCTRTKQSQPFILAGWSCPKQFTWRGEYWDILDEKHKFDEHFLSILSQRDRCIEAAPSFCPKTTETWKGSLLYQLSAAVSIQAALNVQFFLTNSANQSQANQRRFSGFWFDLFILIRIWDTAPKADWAFALTGATITYNFTSWNSFKYKIWFENCSRYI